MGVISGGNVIPGSLGRSSNRLFVYEYDFAVDGGAVGTLVLRPQGSTPTFIPSGTIIDQATIEVLTILASGGSPTVALTSGEGAGDILAATAHNAAPWSTTGRKAGIPTGAANSLKTSAARQVAAVIATAALTGGRFRVILDAYDPAQS